MLKGLDRKKVIAKLKLVRNNLDTMIACASFNNIKSNQENLPREIKARISELQNIRNKILAGKESVVYDHEETPEMR